MKRQVPGKPYSLLQAGLASILTAALMGSAPIVVAQDRQQPEAEDGEQAQDPDREQVLVTGSRLTTNDTIVAPNPVLTVSQEEIDARGGQRIEDITNALPQVFAGQAAEVSNSASGAATLNLRGLGSQRTLVLIDGKRLPDSPQDINLVPTQLVERIDIVTGGASAVYGADAVAGVANFILKRDFEGIEAELQGGFHQAGNDDPFMEQVLAAANVDAPGSTIDGREFAFSLTAGANTADGRGNVTMFFNYQNLNAITQDGRTESACALSASTGPNSFSGVGCVGSGNFRRFFGLLTGIDRFQQEDGTLVPFVGGPAQTFNFGPFNFFQRPIERFQIYTKAHYDITDDLELFADLTFNNQTSDAQIAPSATFGFWETNCDNPLIQTQQPMSLAEVFGCSAQDIADGTDVPVFASHRMVEGGGFNNARSSSIDRSQWRAVGGLRGTLADHFDFEVFGQFARIQDQTTSINDLVIEDVQDAFFVVEDANGNPVCRSGNSACVPLNVFQRTPDGGSLVTAEALDFVQGVGIVRQEVDQIVFGGNIQTDLGRYGIQSPGADAGASILVGGEYRQDSLANVPDEISQQSDGGFADGSGPSLPIEGEIRVHEFFTEGQIPLVTGAPGIEDLTVGGAYRFSDYALENEDSLNSFNTDTWHAFVNWNPVESVRLRAQFQRAMRAPNVVEALTPQRINPPSFDTGLIPSPGFFDPCAGPNPRATLEQCMRTGVTAEQFGGIPDPIGGQVQTVTGGNPNLAPEISDTVTVGLTFTPESLAGLSVSVDYFDIEVDDAISDETPLAEILHECLETGAPVLCNRITRDAAGSLVAGTPGVGIETIDINIATLQTSGLDFQVVYDLDLWDLGMEGMGSMRFDYAATYLDELKTIRYPGADPIQCAGKVLGSCDTPKPEYRHRMITTWATPWNFTVRATWRYFSSVDNDRCEEPGCENVEPFTDRMAERVQYLDLNVDYQATENLSLSVGANNLNGHDIPILTAADPALGNGNTFPTVYDTGTFFFASATWRQ